MQYWNQLRVTLLIHHKLLWSLHINSICNKANRLIGFLRRNLRHCPPINTLCYYAWNTAPLYLGPFSNMFDPPIRDGTACFMLNCPWSRNSCNSISQMLSKLNWCPLETRRKQSHLLLLFKLLNHFVHKNLLPVYSPSGITRASHSIQLIRPYTRMNVYLNSFFPCSTYDWNSLRMNFLSTVSIRTF